MMWSKYEDWAVKASPRYKSKLGKCEFGTIDAVYIICVLN
jgi:hypothetical protein